MNHFESFAREQDHGWKSCSGKDVLPPLSIVEDCAKQETMIGRPLSIERRVFTYGEIRVVPRPHSSLY